MTRRLRPHVVLMVTAMAITSCSTRPGPARTRPSREQMWTHSSLAVELRGLAIRGDVPGFRSSAADLADLAPVGDLPADLVVQFGPLRRHAQDATLVQSREAAALAAATIAKACGDCHVANDVALGERFTVTDTPPGDGTLRHMASLASVSRLLWQGLVGPSDRTWRAGASSLADLGALLPGVTTEPSVQNVTLASDRLRRLGREAASVVEPEDRVQMLAAVLSTCAGCHEDVSG